MPQNINETNTQTIDKVSQFIFYAVNAVNALLLLRLIFKAFGANPVSPIVSVTYGITNTLLLPFRGIFNVAAAGESVVEPSILVAVLIYWLLAKAIVELLYLFDERNG